MFLKILLIETQNLFHSIIQSGQLSICPLKILSSLNILTTNNWLLLTNHQILMCNHLWASINFETAKERCQHDWTLAISKSIAIRESANRVNVFLRGLIWKVLHLLGLFVSFLLLRFACWKIEKYQPQNQPQPRFKKVLCIKKVPL